MPDVVSRWCRTCLAVTRQSVLYETGKLFDSARTVVLRCHRCHRQNPATLPPEREPKPAGLDTAPPDAAKSKPE